MAFATLLGEPTAAHPTVPSLDGNAHILDLDYRNGHKVDRWHTDVTFVDRPPLASVLRAVTVPDAGGDTLWANTVTAYEHLPAELIRLVQEHVTEVENTVRWRWATGDVAVWDNRATQHRVVQDFGDRPRRLHRVTIAGDVPVGVDGRPSVVLAGDAAAYSTIAA